MPQCVLTLKLIGELTNGSPYTPLFFEQKFSHSVRFHDWVWSFCCYNLPLYSSEPLTSPDKLLTWPLHELRCSSDNDSISHPNIVSDTVAFSDYRFVTWLLWWQEGTSELDDFSCFCFLDHSSICWCRQSCSLFTVSQCLWLSFIASFFILSCVKERFHWFSPPSK